MESKNPIENLFDMLCVKLFTLHKRIEDFDKYIIECNKK